MKARRIPRLDSVVSSGSEVAARHEGLAMKDLGIVRIAAHALLVVATSAAVAGSAAANSGGIIGASGKSGGFYCKGCHAGGTLPTVAFDGPTSLDPGTTATFTFIVSSHATAQVAELGRGRGTRQGARAQGLA